ncbi:DMT family transporter [Serratia inhibens]|uniref:EamA-like transporter family protein n=2 Tax=Serratia inhibens TaxID=2338073 RepID=A0AA92X8D2_9GAMM|nr:DMT family transporter [Serratia inhibens]ANS43755.1 Inner membrane protein YdcZ [Serratia inhibens PRI-2C]RJF56100.1 EamA-like transporter family protein [Serratia inhibens]
MNIMLLLLVAAGVSLVAQNLLMVRISESASTILIALVINSSVGLLLLMALLFAKNGASALAEVTGNFRIWMLLPGLLGSFFVFSGIFGYQKLGAATTISVLVASQLVAGLAVDIYKAGPVALRENLPALLGAVLLVVGAFLVARRSF